MKSAERVVMVALFVAIIGGIVWLYMTTISDRQEVRDAVARGEYEIPLPEKEDKNNNDDTQTSTSTDQADWRVHYPVVVPMLIGSTTVAASIADTLPERIKGLSGTPYLPDGVVKLFAFGTAGEHSIWMKDMNYAIDIMWASESGKIVHIEENVSPETFPESFASPVPALYVIETNAGFVAANAIKKGDMIVVPQ